MYWQDYQNGSIVGNDKNGYHESMGGVRARWASLNFQSGVLGMPTSDMQLNPSTGILWQNYEHGVIVGNNEKGYYESRGSIRNVWQKYGFESGKFGFPTSNIMYDKQSDMYWQNYQGGSIVGNDKLGHFESFGEIRTVWAKNGFQSGKLGLPTSDVIQNGTIQSQTYQHGTIYYDTSTKKTWIKN